MLAPVAPRLRPARFAALALLATACGSRSGLQLTLVTARAGDARADTSFGVAPDAPGFDAAPIDAAPEAPRFDAQACATNTPAPADPAYVGTITLGAHTLQGGVVFFTGYADFAPGPAPPVGRACSCETGFIGPAVGVAASAPAGVVVVLASCGGDPVMSLTDFQTAGPASATSDVYSAIEGQTVGWNPGDVLVVTAPGGAEVGAFSGALATGEALTGITPAIGVAPVVVSLGQDLVITWTPEADPSGHVIVGLVGETSTSTRSCSCEGPDAPGVLRIAAADLAGFVPSSAAVAGVTVRRQTTTVTSIANVEIRLVGERSIGGPATFQ